ncbi:hypothetical protein ABDI30_24295 [Paenibacillus cisolokensis]|uniref:hypothetical protein n=1 Tax=Paenibacillus cisolokensis TaxID=1658519 RepID=UPI003D2E2C61
MKKIILSFIALVLFVTLPISAYADVSFETEQTVFESQFALIESDSTLPSEISEESLRDYVISNKTAQASTASTLASVGGFGTIKCYALGSGKMSCDWSVTLTKSGEAIQNLFVIFEVSTSDKIVGTKEVYKEPLGGNGKTYRDQIDFNPGKGSFKVEKYGAVAGRYAVYNIVSITPDYINVY